LRFTEIYALINKTNNEIKKYNSCFLEISPITVLSESTLNMNRMNIVHSIPRPASPTLRKIISKKIIPVTNVNF
jgi:hypothetical protein